MGSELNTMIAAFRRLVRKEHGVDLDIRPTTAITEGFETFSLLTIDEVIEGVHYCTGWKKETNRSRKKEPVYRRWVTIYCCLLSGYTISAIGRKLGYDHTTIIHGRNEMEKLLEMDRDVRRVIREIIDHLKQYTKEKHGKEGYFGKVKEPE